MARFQPKDRVIHSVVKTENKILFLNFISLYQHWFDLIDSSFFLLILLGSRFLFLWLRFLFLWLRSRRTVQDGLPLFGSRVKAPWPIWHLSPTPCLSLHNVFGAVRGEHLLHHLLLCGQGGHLEGLPGQVYWAAGLQVGVEDLLTLLHLLFCEENCLESAELSLWKVWELNLLPALRCYCCFCVICVSAWGRKYLINVSKLLPASTDMKSKNIYFTEHGIFTLPNFVSNCKTASFTMFC